MSVFTAFVAKKKLSSRCVIRQASIVSEQGRKAFARQQVSAFKTVAIMQVGFSLSVGKLLVFRDRRHSDFTQIKKNSSHELILIG